MDIFDYLTIYNDRDFYNFSRMDNKYSGHYMDAFFIYQVNCEKISTADLEKNTIIFDIKKVNEIDFESVLRRDQGDILEEIGGALRQNEIFLSEKEISGKYLNGDNNYKLIHIYKYIKTTSMQRDSIKNVLNLLDIDIEKRGMAEFTEYVIASSDLNVLLKSLIINYYGTFISGNDSFGPIMLLWYLLQNGYNIKETFNFSNIVLENKEEYNNIIKQTLKNKEIISYIDITPYLNFIVNKVNKLSPKIKPLTLNGDVTNKEEALYIFAKEYFGKDSFSSKDLEKAYNNSSYETIRKFLMKFTKLGYLSKINYSSRPRYVIL